MRHTRGIVAVSAAATIATLLFGLHGVTGFWPLWGMMGALARIAVLVGGVAAVVVLIAGFRARDRRALAVGTSAVAFALAWWVPGVLGSALYFVAEAALVAFGLLTVRSAVGVHRVLGWVVTIAAAGWFVSGLLTQTVAPPTTSQEVLVVLFAIPSVFQAGAYLAAAVLVAMPLLRPVGRGAGALWSSAEVR